MVNRLVWQNLLHRPVRTLLSVAAVAVEVVLILIVVGLSQGMLEESQRRARGVGADILIRPSTSQVAMGLSSAELSQKLVDLFADMPSVQAAAGTTVYLFPNLQTITGVDLESFSRLSGGLKYLAGGPFGDPYEAVVDEVWARQNRLGVGSTTEIWNRQFRVTGIVEPGKLSRVFIPMATMQDLLGWKGKLSQIYLKLRRPEETPSVIAELNRLLPAAKIYSMEEFTSLISIHNIGGLSQFITVIIGLAVTVGFLVVMLAMYTAILERTREIGILKSLGASRLYIVGVVMRETLLLTALGIGAGILLSFAASAAIQKSYPILTVTLHRDWWLYAGLIAVGGAGLGALYPAARAAAQDPIAALAYE